MTAGLRDQVYKLEDQGWRRVGSGDWGIVLEKGEQVKKITTDSEELDHAEKLLNHASPYVIPILKVERLDDKLGIIDMPNAQEIGNDEKEAIRQYGKYAEEYIVYEEDEALNEIPEGPLREFVQGLRTAYEKAGIYGDEIDWSPFNIMRYKGKYVLVDV